MTVPRLHVITDETVQDRYRHVELAEFALAGGADAVQFREKRPRNARQLIDVAAAIASACRSADAALIVDDRADVCLSVGAAGVHVGRNDLDVATARRIVGPNALIGGTANSLEEAIAVAATDVDYLGVGPVYGTQSKANPAPVMGLDTLSAIVEHIGKPVIAIGGITAVRIPEVMATGVHGIAVLSVVVAADDPAAAAAACCEAMA